MSRDGAASALIPQPPPPVPEARPAAPGHGQSHLLAQRPSRRSVTVAIDDDARTVHRRVGAAQRGNHAIAASFDRAQIDEEHLVFAMVDDLAEQVPATREIGTRHLAFEHRVLQVITKAARHAITNRGKKV